MRKLKEVLRLHALGLSQHQIARGCSISLSTVHEYLSAAQAAGVKWPAPETWDDQQIERTLFPQRPAPSIWRQHLTGCYFGSGTIGHSGGNSTCLAVNCDQVWRRRADRPQALPVRLAQSLSRFLRVSAPPR